MKKVTLIRVVKECATLEVKSFKEAKQIVASINAGTYKGDKFRKISWDVLDAKIEIESPTNQR